MSSKHVMRGMIAFYIFLFFLYLFGPLLVMSVTAFNTPSYPQAYPFEAFTLDWFVKLWNHRAMMDGLRNSVIIGLGVVTLAVPIGLSAAIIMNQIYHRARGLYYLVTISPLLTPGVIIGISTVIFWKDMLGLTEFTKETFYKGIILTIFGQASFVSAYCLLIFMARLTRFDRSQEEAALDLGAQERQPFVRLVRQPLHEIDIVVLESHEHHLRGVAELFERLPEMKIQERFGHESFDFRPSVLMDGSSPSFPRRARSPPAIRPRVRRLPSLP